MRICSKCGKHLVSEGFVIDGGYSYYCSEECLYQDMTKDEWEELYQNGNSESYWTSWDTIELMVEEEEVEFDIEEITRVVELLGYENIEQLVEKHTPDDVKKLQEAISKSRI